MASIVKTFAITAIALGALTANIRPSYAQTAPQATTDMDEPEEEAVFHRLDALEVKRLTFPKSIPTREWQTAFCGWYNDPPSPQYLATLFRDYAKASRANQALTIKWVEALADELVQRGDAKMFLLLAEHYVKYNYPQNIYGQFLGQPNTFDLELSRLGNLLKKSVAALSPAYQQQFKKDLGIAAASYLVAKVPNSAGGVNYEPQPDFIPAVLAYELMTRYVPSDEGLAAFEAIIKNATFEAEDLRGFFTLDGVRDFTVVASGFMPNITLERSPLIHVFNMGLRIDKQAGEGFRNMFIDAIKDNTPDETLFAINQVYRLAAEQRFAGKDETMAQQMVSKVWEDAVSAVMTPKMIREIYLQHYTGKQTKPPQSFHIARKKRFNGAQEIEMQDVFADVLKATVKTPQAYYRLINDFAHDESFSKAFVKENSRLQSQHILTHFSYLATIYIDDQSVAATIDSNIRMMHLMRLDATLPPQQRVTSAGFQRAILQLAKTAKNSTDQSNQLIKLVATANNTGWDKHITAPFIDNLRKNLLVLRGSFAAETLDSILRVQADQRALEKQLQKQWKNQTQVKPVR